MAQDDRALEKIALEALEFTVGPRWLRFLEVGAGAVGSASVVVGSIAVLRRALARGRTDESFTRSVLLPIAAGLAAGAAVTALSLRDGDTDRENSN